jgi:ABC-type transport system substrate-binding protein
MQMTTLTMLRMNLLLLAAAACLPIFSPSGFAQATATWTGGGVSGSYNDPDNWDVLSVPVNNGTTYVENLNRARWISVSLNP